MDVGGASGCGVHSCLKAENTMRFYHLVVLREYLACTGPDYLGEARSFMEIGVRPVRYEDLNSDLPVCITRDFLLIQSVTGLHYYYEFYL